MSVQLNPSTQIGFNRPFTQIVCRTLTVVSHNERPVTFKVKTTAPKAYCVRPNMGVINPGDSIDIIILMMAMPKDPPISTKCRDKFLIQSMIIPQDQLHLTPCKMWQFSKEEQKPQIYQQKIRVAYLPAEGRVLGEKGVGHTSIMSGSELHSTEYQDMDQSSRSPAPLVSMPLTQAVPGIAPAPVPTKGEGNVTEAAALAELKQRHPEARIEIKLGQELLSEKVGSG
ncbi:hypothetical protein OPQ81_002598 [Rhizoctonia solani]|nr:hypothetical protein OPQ81_002598 [Rhizoctonia solani]